MVGRRRGQVATALPLLLLLSRPLEADAASVRAETLSVTPAATQLTNDSWVPGTVASGEWVDFFFLATAEANIEFEVVARSQKPSSVGIYVTEGAVTSVDPATGVPTLSQALHGDDPPSSGNAPLSWDISSDIGNSTHRHFYAYVGQCYVMIGRYYFVSVYGALYDSTDFQVRARELTASMGEALTYPIDPTTITVSSRVCDGMYMHHYYDVTNAPHTGGFEFKIKRESGELDAWFLRYEKCGGRSGQSIKSGNLFGHGLMSESVTLPSLTTGLVAGRYYISVRGSLELCGNYTVTVTGLTAAQVSAANS